MAYARPGEFGSDVYVVRTDPGHIECHHDADSTVTTSEADMINHLMNHRRMGDTVPQRALDRLQAERDGIEYETDVESALRNLRQGGVID